MKALLIPVKEPGRAKTRLDRLLSADERRQLAWAMFEDVSRTLVTAKNADRIFIVTSFDKAIERAGSLGLDVLKEESQESESASVDWASRRVREQGFDTVMRLPADIPLVRAEDLDELLATRLKSPAALLVPSRDGTGTNAIIRTPADLFPSRFGPNSLALHNEEAARVGVHPLVVANPRIALDIDDPADLKLFLESGRGTTTFDTLVEMGIFDRIGGI